MSGSFWTVGVVAVAGAYAIPVAILDGLDGEDAREKWVDSEEGGAP